MIRIGIGVSFIVAAALVAGSLPQGEASQPAAAAGPRAVATEAEARAACGTCHGFPPPDALPRRLWKPSIARMALIQEGLETPARLAGLEVIPDLPAEMARILRYYEQRAPAELPAPEPWPDPDQTRLRFVRRPLDPPYVTPAPAVSHVRLADLTGDGRLELLVTDMRHGVVMRGAPYDPAAGLEVVARVPYPSFVQVANPAGSGAVGLLVAGLGAFYPGDHLRGSVAWLQAREGGGYESHAADGFPRVASVEGADFTGDGSLGLLVSAFGFRQEGYIALLENVAPVGGQLTFDARIIDGRPGAIRAIPVDLNDNGRLDFVAVIAQEHERVVAYLNEGGGRFREQLIYAGPHPSWGMSGIDVVDLQGDGRLDVLLVHGDMFDDGLPKPYHGVMWLENRGVFPFTPHRLANLPGVHAARAADLTDNGLPDIVAAVFMHTEDCEALGVPSLVWLEQVTPGRFERRTLAGGPCQHATFDLGDFDGDGNIDLVLGRFTFEAPADTSVEVWKNIGMRDE